PKRVRPVEKEAEEEKSEEAGTSLEERKERAEAKKREAQNKRAANKGGETKKDIAVPSPARKKNKAKMDDQKFDPSKILQQAAYATMVDAFVPLTDESLRLDDDSMQSMQSLSPGLLGNLSIRHTDSPDGAARALHDQEGKDGNLGAIDNVVGSAVQFLRVAYRGKAKKASDSLNAPYKRGRTIFNVNMFCNVISQQSDLSLLERTYSAAELVLLSSPVYPMGDVYTKALAAIYNTRRTNERMGVNEAMTINQCLAWLACAARCSVASLVPQGEYYPDAEDYLRIRLIVSKLPLLSNVCVGVSGPEWAVYSTLRCMQMMAVADLSPLPTDDRCILLYAIGMLYIDDVATEEMREAAHSLVRNVLNSCTEVPLLLEPLFNLTPLMVKRPDEAHKWILMFKASGVAPPDLLLSMAAAHFVQLCERAECTPDAFYTPSLRKTCTSYLNVLAETGFDAFHVYSATAHRRFHKSLVSILNCCLTVSALRLSERTSKQALIKCLEAVRGKLNPDLADDSIIITELRSLARRLEKQPSGKGGRRDSGQIIRIMEERAKRKEEKEEQLREEKKEKAILKQQREDTQRNAAMREEEKEEKELNEKGLAKIEMANGSLNNAMEVDEENEKERGGEGAAAAMPAAAESMETDGDDDNGSADLADTVAMD
ncbi:hypothetical protein PFISCL1PPCAC_28912, partial [Pristionchus fissidentatus]